MKLPAVALVGLLACNAHATPIDANFLNHLCTAAGSDAEIDRLTCTVYIAGYVDGVILTAKLNRLSDDPIRACPGNAEIRDYEEAFKRWAAHNPEWLQRPAREALAASTVQAFPCPRDASR